jgi:hypothetical protein
MTSLLQIQLSPPHDEAVQFLVINDERDAAQFEFLTSQESAAFSVSPDVAGQLLGLARVVALVVKKPFRASIDGVHVAIFLEEKPHAPTEVQLLASRRSPCLELVTLCAKIAAQNTKKPETIQIMASIRRYFD